MGWVNPIPTSPDLLAEGLTTYTWLVQYPKAIQERVKAAMGAALVAWPPASFSYATGAISGTIADNGDGTYTLTDGSGNSYTTNQWAHQTSVPAPHDPTDFDLIIDFPKDETKCLHFRILSNTATTVTICDTQWASGPNLPDIIADAATSGFLGTTKAAVRTALSSGQYYIVRAGGIWWHERWLAFPNDQEKWVGVDLVAGALQVVTSLVQTSGTATATTQIAHQFINGDTVTIAGAVPSGYNGSVTISGVTSTTFQYTVSSGLASPASGTITATNPNVGAHDARTNYPPAVPNYPAHKWSSGCQLMVIGSDNALKRITLTDNDATNLYFTRQSYQVSGQYAIVATGNRYRRYDKTSTDCRVTGVCAAGTNTIGQGHMQTYNNPNAGNPQVWYDGLAATYWTRGAGDVSTCPVNATSTLTNWARTTGALEVIEAITLKNNNVGCSGTFSQTVFDTDFFTDPFDDCNSIGGDICYTPGLFRTIHGWQKKIELVCPWYVPPDLTKLGLHAAAGSNDMNGGPLVTFTPATLFYYCGINSQKNATGGSGSGSGIPLQTGVTSDWVAAGSFHRPVLFFSIHNTDGTLLLSGTGYCDGSGHFTGITFDQGGNFTGIGSGFTMFLSKGWTRKYPNEFMYLYPKECWIPDPNPITGAPVDPPATVSGTFYPGTWTNRAASQYYKEDDGFGGVRDSNGWRTPATNDFGRCVGDNIADPAIHASGTTEFSTDQSFVMRNYWNNFYDGQWSPANQATINTAKMGTATAGTFTQLQDTSKNWWGGIPGTNTPWSIVTDSFGVGCTSFGTFDGGTTTDPSDSTKAGDPLWARSRWLGAVVEVQQGGVWYRRYIQNYFNSTDLQLRSDDPLPSAPSGSKYRIREGRYERSRWGNRTLVLTRAADGSVHNIPILANDDNTIYFAAQAFAIVAGDTYQIQEKGPGTYQWNGSTWVQPTGNDPRTGVPWKTNPAANQPMWATGYGKVLKGDDLGWMDLNDTTLNGAPRSIWNEMYTVLQVLIGVSYDKMFGGQAVWASNGEQNTRHGEDSANAIYQNGSTGARDVAETAYDAGTTSVDGKPYCITFELWTGSCYTYQLDRRYAYEELDSINTYEASTAAFWVFPLIPTASDGSSGTSASNGSCPHIRLFDANGDNVGSNNSWFNFSNKGPVNSTNRTSDALGLSAGTNPISASPRPDAIGDLGGGAACDEFLGYTIANWTAILWWNVAGGFVYQ